MSDPTRDPIRRLEDFATTAVLDVTPLDPAQVRRLGDRRRARRRAAYAAASLVAVVATVVPVALTAGRGDNTSPEPMVTGGPAAVITYPGAGIEVVDPADTRLLRGAPDDFKAFVGQLAERLETDNQSCPGADHGVTVRKISDDGYALGAVNSCGGYVALWVRQDSRWKEALGTQDEWRCSDLARYAIPVSFAGDCYDPPSGFGPTTVDGLGLGMDADQVAAAGGSIQPPASDGDICRGLVLPSRSPLPDQVDGYYDTSRGVVGISARAGMRTPEGIGLGSTRAAVERAYPQGRLNAHGYWVVPLTGDSEYQIGLESGRVSELMLAAINQDCWG